MGTLPSSAATVTGLGRFDPKIDFQRDPYLLAQHAAHHNTVPAKLEIILHLADSIGVVGCLSNRFAERTFNQTRRVHGDR